MASVDELLAQTRALTQSQQSGASVDDLLAQTRSVVPGPQTTKKSDEQTTAEALAGSVSAEAAPSLVPPEGVGRVLDAAKEGWQAAPTFPRVPSSYVTAPIYNPLIAAAEAVLGAGGAILRGGQQTVQEVLTPINPQLGRDVAALPEAFPFGFGNLRPPVRPAIPGGAPTPTPKFVGERMAPPREPGATDLERIQQLIRHDEAEQVGVGPDIQPGGAGPQPAGAQATPASAAKLSPAEMKANRRQAEKAEILAPADLGDTNIYVKGSLPTKAEYSGDPTVSQYETVLRARDPNAFEGPKGRITENNAARVTHYEEMTPSDTALNGMKEARSRQWQADTNSILPTAKPVDLAPVKRTFDEILDNPRNLERDELQRVLGPLREKLTDANGNLKTDPESVWGMHDNLQTKLTKAKDSTAEERHVITELKRVKDAIDAAMNVATDNRFQTALDNFANASRDINSGELLRQFRDKLTNTKGDLQANVFHKWVRDLAEHRGEPGIDPSMDISDETMRGLINLDKDLKRAGLIDLGKARGSPTNLYGALAKNMGIGAAHVGTALLTAPTHGVGNLLLQGAINAGKEVATKAMLSRRVRQHLAPPPGGYNPLNEPGP